MAIPPFKRMFNVKEYIMKTLIITITIFIMTGWVGISHAEESRFAEKERLADEILHYGMNASVSETQMLTKFTEAFRTAFVNKQSESIAEMISGEALLVTGSTVNGGEVQFRRTDRSEYVTRIQNRVFVDGNDIEVEFEDVAIYRHPRQQGVYGITFAQHYNTTIYSDYGYVLMMVEVRDQEAHITLRLWQQEPFTVGKAVFQTEAIEEIYVPTVGREGLEAPIYSNNNIAPPNLSSDIVVRPVAYTPAVKATPSTGFLANNKYWVIAGAATVTGAGIALIASSGSGGGDNYLPVPPGRP